MTAYAATVSVETAGDTEAVVHARRLGIASPISQAAGAPLRRKQCFSSLSRRSAPGSNRERSHALPRSTFVRIDLAPRGHRGRSRSGPRSLRKLSAARARPISAPRSARLDGAAEVFAAVRTPGASIHLETNDPT